MIELEALIQLGFKNVPNKINGSPTQLWALDGGTVYSENRGRILKPSDHVSKYNQYTITCLIDGEIKTMTYLEHECVYYAYKGLPPKDGKKYVVDHINGNRRDNRLVNLQLLTAEENSVKRTNKKGEQEILVTQEIADSVREDWNSGNYKTIDLQHKYRLGPPAVWNILRNRNWYNDAYESKFPLDDIKYHLTPNQIIFSCELLTSTDISCEAIGEIVGARVGTIRNINRGNLYWAFAKNYTFPAKRVVGNKFGMSVSLEVQLFNEFYKQTKDLVVVNAEINKIRNTLYEKYKAKLKKPQLQKNYLF